MDVRASGCFHVRGVPRKHQGLNDFMRRALGHAHIYLWVRGWVNRLGWGQLQHVPAHPQRRRQRGHRFCVRKRVCAVRSTTSSVHSRFFGT